MTAGELIKKLQQFDPAFAVVITDGFEAICYEGDFEIAEFEGTVDIGVGGLNHRPTKTGHVPTIESF